MLRTCHQNKLQKRRFNGLQGPHGLLHGHSMTQDDIDMEMGKRFPRT